MGKRNNGRKLFFDKKGMISPLSHDSPSNAPITGSSIHIGCIISILKRRRSDLIERKKEKKEWSSLDSNQTILGEGLTIQASSGAHVSISRPPSLTYFPSVWATFLSITMWCHEGGSLLGLNFLAQISRYSRRSGRTIWRLRIKWTKSEALPYLLQASPRWKQSKSQMGGERSVALFHFQ